MAALAELTYAIRVYDTDGLVLSVPTRTTRFTPGLGNGQRQTVSLPAATFTALTAPTSAKFLAILLPSTALSCTLKGVTGDAGIALTPSSNALGLPVILPLGTSPVLGILNAGLITSCELIWI